MSICTFTNVLIRFAIPITGLLDDALVLQEEIEVKTLLEVVGLVLLYVCPSQYAANLWKMSHTRNSLLPLGVQFIFWRYTYSTFNYLAVVVFYRVF